MDRPYSILGVDPGANEERVREAYRTLMKTHHPDHGGSTETFIRIKEAYEAIQRGDAASGTHPGSGAGSVRRSTDGGTATRTGGAAAPTRGTAVEPTEHADQSAVNCCSGVGLELRGEYLTVRLVALIEDADVGAFVASHMLDGRDERTIAFFTVENASDRTVRWRGNQCLSFVGSDGRSYESAGEYCASDPKLPSGWTGSDVAVEPGAQLQAVVIAEEFPAEIDVTELAYTQNVFARAGAGSGIEDKERFRFAIGSSVKPLLSRPPF
ncbi:MAG TPA: DnaJ domain-containing protein [Natronoarchaeum rubrum]|nr:DnaJ domain-containing protein [Natronoarchaeum rubrum]